MKKFKYQTFLLFCQQHNVIVKKHPTLEAYLYCTEVSCSDCSIEKLCEKHSFIFTLKEHKFLKSKHPEYFL